MFTIDGVSLQVTFNCFRCYWTTGQIALFCYHQS